jgi:hypothetical protein
MFSSNSSEQVYFVDNTKDSRTAFPVQDHPEFRVHWQESARNIRLFVPREAVEAVAKLVGRKAQ